MDEIRVGIGEFVITDGNRPLSIHGLGSCVGVMLYEKELRIAALAHILLPESNDSERLALFPGKYVTSALDAIIEEILDRGGGKNNIIAKIAGGAHMFNFSSPQIRITIGDKNITAVREKLGQLGIELFGEDVGGSHGRSMIVDPSTGAVLINTVQHGTIEL